MIALASDHLLFQLDNGEYVPFSLEAVSVELVGDTGIMFDAEFVRHAAAAVVHHFRRDLNRVSVTVAEFSCALEQALRGFTPATTSSEPTQLSAARAGGADLRLLVVEAGRTELIFFPRLREEVRNQLRRSPQRLRFLGLRGCVKQLTGARRWSPRCRDLQKRILNYLCQCLTAETSQAPCTLVVEQ
jgi:hypothetical protein